MGRTGNNHGHFSHIPLPPGITISSRILVTNNGINTHTTSTQSSMVINHQNVIMYHATKC
jgi:hypothetical protein